MGSGSGSGSGLLSLLQASPDPAMNFTPTRMDQAQRAIVVAQQIQEALTVTLTLTLTLTLKAWQI